jgi:uncharacterized membrane protein YecN with MAPEG domain
LKVTLLYGGLSALLVTLLGINVSLMRMRTQLLAGAPLPPREMMKVRAHGNAAEWVPLGILLMLVLELGGARSMWLHLLGGGFLFARLLHAGGFLFRIPTSAIGATLNYLVLTGMCGYTVYLHFH